MAKGDNWAFFVPIGMIPDHSSDHSDESSNISNPTKRINGYKMLAAGCDRLELDLRNLFFKHFI